VLDKGI